MYGDSLEEHAATDSLIPFRHDANEPEPVLVANTAPSKFTAYASVIIATIETLIASGIIFGWSALLIVLEDQGVYSALCQPGQNTCELSQKRLQKIFTIGSSLFAIAVWPMGALLDLFGPKVTFLLGSMLFSAGCWFFSISEFPRFDAYLLSFCLMSIGGPTIVMSFMHLSNLFPANRGTIITIFNVMLDASAVMFAFYALLFRGTGLSILHFFLSYAVVGIVMFIIGIFLWPHRSYELPKTRLSYAGTSIMDDDDAAALPQPAAEESNHNTEEQLPPGSAVVVNAMQQQQNGFLQQARSAAFVLLLVYHCVQILRVNFYLATVDLQLRSIAHNARLANEFGEIFSWVLPAGGVLSVPLVSYALDGKGLLPSAFLLTASATIFGMLTCVEKMFDLQLLSFVVFAFWRAFHFSFVSSYLAMVFGFANFGKLWGLAFFISGLLNLGIYSATSFVYEYLDGDFFYVNFFSTIVSVLSFFFPIYLWIKATTIQPASATRYNQLDAIQIQDEDNNNNDNSDLDDNHNNNEHALDDK